MSTLASFEKPSVTIAPSVLSGLKAKIAAPLIGSPEFTRSFLLECEDARRRDGTGSAVVRYRRFARAIQAMLDAPFAPHSLASLAAGGGMSRSAFAQCFSATFGRSPLDFLKAERLRVAAHLLCSNPLPVKWVAKRVGYDSVSYFSRSFRAAFGLSPTELVNSVRHDPVVTGLLRDPAAGFLSLDEANALGAITDRLKLICNATLDVLWDIDLTTGLVWWSEGMSRIFGYGPNQIGPDTSWCHDNIHPDDRARVVAGMQAACADGQTLCRDESATGNRMAVTPTSPIAASSSAIRPERRYASWVLYKI